METLEAMAARTAQQEDPQIVECKRLFAPALVELRQLRTEYQKQKPSWMGRLATLQAKWQLALASRYPADINIVTKFEDLAGGRGPAEGLVLGTESLIALYIHNIEVFGPRDLPHRDLWLAWPNSPRKILDNFGGIERTLAFLEQLLRDGGAVYEWVRERAPAAQSPRVFEPQRPAPRPKVETVFDL